MGFRLQERANLPIGRARVESHGGKMARRTNYGFEKRQRELRKQRKKEKKAERRGLKESNDPTSARGEAVDYSPPDPAPRDRD